MWRFKASKYKNAIPKVPNKTEEGWILGISVGSPNSHGNNIKASGAFMAFSLDTRGGGSLGVLPVDNYSKKNGNIPMLHAHADLITDFDFCPYDDGILATCSQDCHIKIWRIPKEGLISNTPCNPVVDLPVCDHRVEIVTFNPSVDCVLACAEDKHVRIWDVSQKKEIWSDSSHKDIVQSLSWKLDGSLLVSSGRDAKLNIYDPRTNKELETTSSHAICRDSRVLWLGDTDKILSSGISIGRNKELILRDVRKFSEPLATYSGESSPAVFIPLYDPDTNMLFLATKADATLSYWEVTEVDPFFCEAAKYVGDVQAKGITLIPKRALKVMIGEVNRVMLLGPDCLVPVSYQVPRKSYRDFHSDLFPDTYAPEPSATVDSWLANENLKMKKISLDPTRTQADSLLSFNHQLGSGPNKHTKQPCVENVSSSIRDKVVKEIPEEKITASSKNIVNSNTSLCNSSKPQIPQKPAILPKLFVEGNVHKTDSLNGFKEKSPVDNKSAEPSRPLSAQRSEPWNAASRASNRSPSPRRAGRTFGMRVSKFRHLNGIVLPKETHITNVTNLSKTIPGESDAFHANSKLVAMPVGSAGGHIAILQLSKTGRLPPCLSPGVICGTSIMDFEWDPFDNYRLAVGCDTGDIQLWKIPDEITECLTEPNAIIRGHKEKVNVIKFHPTTSDVLASCSFDLTVRIWDLIKEEEKLCLIGHSEQVFGLSWSFDGKQLATVCKDQVLRIYNPRSSPDPIKQGPGPQGCRGARVVWVLGGSHIVVSGFSKVSERQISLYDVKDLASPIGVVGIDVSPSILIPFYDEGSSTLFLSGKGDTVVFAYEVATDAPYFHPLSNYQCSGPHQALSFLPKCVCNVADVEFAKAFRLTQSTIEPVSFIVPRLRSEYFQDDLFPDARVTWKPSASSAEWFSGKDSPPNYVSLQPEGMIPLSQAPPPVKSVEPSQASTETSKEEMLVFEGDAVLSSSLAFLQGGKEKEEQIVQAMKLKCQFEESSLPQDSYEGVDPVEWDEDEK